MGTLLCSTDDASYSVECSFASQTGYVLIPKTVLYQSGGQLSLYTYRARTVPAGGYAIDLEARGVVLDPVSLKGVFVVLTY